MIGLAQLVTENWRGVRRTRMVGWTGHSLGVLGRVYFCVALAREDEDDGEDAESGVEMVY